MQRAKTFLEQAVAPNASQERLIEMIRPSDQPAG